MATSTQESNLRQRQHPSSPSLSPAPQPSITTSSQTQSWLPPALASGAFAAANGLFAKLTTSTSTHLSTYLSSQFPSLSPYQSLLELLLRIFFFLLNLASNGVMWSLFTRALKAGDSATRVSVVNTSVNFLVTALLGAGVFGEELGTRWWLGAGCLVVGNVIISRGNGNGDSDEKGGKEL